MSLGGGRRLVCRAWRRPVGGGRWRIVVIGRRWRAVVCRRSVAGWRWRAIARRRGRTAAQGFGRHRDVAQLVIGNLNVLCCRTGKIDDPVRIIGESIVHGYVHCSAVGVVLHLDHGSEGQVVVRCGPALGLINRPRSGVMPRIVIRDVGGISPRFISGLGAAGQQSWQRDDKESKKLGIFHDLLSRA